MKITELKKIGNTNRYKMFVDNKFFAIILDETIIENKLDLFTNYNEDKLNEIVLKGQKKVAFDISLSLLSKFSKTEKELKLYLKNKGLNEESINFAIDKLKEYNYINDDFYTKNYINNKKKSKSKKSIIFNLKLKGIDNTIIEKNIALIDNQKEIMQNIANKYLKNKKFDTKIKEKLFRHLLSKGFEYEDIKSICKDLIKENDNENWN